MRTTVSNWVYRIATAAMIVGAATVLHATIKIADHIAAETPGLVDPNVATMSLIIGSLGLIFATVAMLLRSGAVIWLLPLYWLSVTASIATQVVSVGTFASVVFAILAVFVPLLIVLPLLFWLVKREEIRRP